MKFGIITYILHKEKKGRFYSYAPYISEMNIWLKFASKSLIAAPKISGNPLVTEIPYSEAVEFSKVPSLNFTNFGSSLISLLKMPKVIWEILKVMRQADHIHLRCPGNISLIGCFLQIFFPKKPKTVKYAGNWDPEANQPWTYRLQKWILGNTFLSRNIKVLVYGDWPRQSRNIVPFFTASFSEEEKERIRKDFRPPYKFIFTGNLVEGKGVFEAIKLIEVLNSEGVDSKLEIYGDGILKDSLNHYMQKKELQKFVKLRGRKSLEELKEAYKKAHFVILLSKSEGWPKTIAEGMWYGCVPVSTSVSCVPWMLNAPSAPKGEASVITLAERGILLNNRFLYKLRKNRQFECPDGSRDVSRTGFSEPLKVMSSEKTDLAGLVRLLKDPVNLKEMTRAAQDWSQQYTLERFEKAIQEILVKQTTNSKSQTINYTPITDNRQPTTNNSKLITHNPQPTTDNNKQQIPNPNKPQRVLQLIDSLRPGGAEKMAVNIANALADKISGSFLCVTRQEGLLKEDIHEEVSYLFLQKKNSFDLKALFRLRNFILKEKIEIVHAHGTSWFFGVMLKLMGTKIKLIWHDHYGESENLKARNIRLLKLLSAYFDGVISVNSILKKWAENNLKIHSVIHLNNFITKTKNENPALELKGANNSIKVICVSNLRPQKDHLNLLNAFEISSSSNSNLTLHLVGEDPGTTYSKMILDEINASPFKKNIFYYGIQQNIQSLLAQADMGILSSYSEGMPLVLLEYGMAGLPVICTKVGQCAEVLGDTGELVEAGKSELLAKTILRYASMDENLRIANGKKFKKRIKEYFAKDSVIESLLLFYKKI